MNEKIVALILLIIGILGYDYYTNYPFRQRMLYSQMQTNSQLKNDLATAKNAQSEIDKLKEEVQKTQSQVDQLLERLPKKHQVGALLEQITSIGSNKGIRFEAVSPTSSLSKVHQVKVPKTGIAGKINYEEMQMKMELTAFFQEFGMYLESLEQIPRLVDVVGLQMKASSPYKPLNIKMNVKTYVYGGK